MIILAYRMFGFDHRPIYRLDFDVYRMGARAWLKGIELYGPTGSNKFVTELGTPLAFTYPPIAAIIFSVFTIMSLPTASALFTAITLVLLLYAVYLVLDSLEVWPQWAVTRESSAVRRGWLALTITGFASLHLEPIWSNFGYGQINVVIMTLALADCLPRRTLLPRGILLGIAIALKLTPAVFLLYFLTKRDWRAARTAVVSFGAATAVGFALAWRDSIDFWTGTVTRTAGRLTDLRLNTNQNILSFLARQALPDALRGPLWLLLSVLVLVLVVWAVRHAVAAGYDAFGVACAALLALLISPVSWSHHWVWVVPVLISTTVVGYRERNLVLLAVSAIGVAVTKWSQIKVLPSGHEWSAPWRLQLLGTSYVWWALAVIVTIGLTVRRRADSPITSAAAGSDDVGDTDRRFTLASFRGRRVAPLVPAPEDA
ncbi:MAG: DUF2029 domain-containing protein [Mycobacterium sp.]|uniref:glycosyltransferase family 87 protein n=1 Tax=Mycobacterium sp. TaxID=1785 RepID=UPI001EBF395E|nr:glycosyltransferase family 87 protein [Mycobacterium sp.]MBW0017377.1 DUF2029 domain-containing protein [Mycobacterium sp.]